jgi:hypothetical protein
MLVRQPASFACSAAARLGNIAVLISAAPATTAWLARVRALLPYVGGVAASLLLGFSVAGGQPIASAVAGMLLVLSYAAIALSFEPERLFILWLVFAPFFQESSRSSSLGDVLNIALYTLPPLFLVLSFALKERRHRLTAVDLMPALYLLYVVASWLLISSHPQSIGRDFRSIYLAIGIGVLIYYFIILGPTTSKLVERIARALITSGIVISIMTLYEALSGWNLWDDLAWHQSSPPRAVATLANPATLGTFLGIVIAFSLAVLIWDGPKSLRKLSLLCLHLHSRPNDRCRRDRSLHDLPPFQDRLARSRTSHARCDRFCCYLGPNLFKLRIRVPFRCHGHS